LLVPNAMLPLMRRLPLATRGRGLGGFTAALYFGQFVSPLVVLAFIHRLGDLRAAVAGVAACAAIAALAWCLAGVVRRPEI
jgi:MFS family permease